MNIKNIVFDIGNVLFAYNPEKIIDEIIGKTPYKTLYLEKLFYRKTLWHDLDIGKQTEAEAKTMLTKSVNHNSEHTEALFKLFDNWVYHLDPIKESKALMLEWRNMGHPIYFLTNFQDKPYDKLIQAFPFMQHAEGAIVSAKVHLAKPDPKIYDLLVTTFKLNPHETLFIDDKPENIEAAIRCGWSGIVFENPHQLKHALTAYQFAYA